MAAKVGSKFYTILMDKKDKKLIKKDKDLAQKMNKLILTPSHSGPPKAVSTIDGRPPRSPQHSKPPSPTKKVYPPKPPASSKPATTDQSEKSALKPKEPSIYGGLLPTEVSSVSPKQANFLANLLIQKGYKTAERCGMGNYAHVFRVLTKTNKEMAVKVIELGNVTANYKLRFMPRELDIISRFQHKNIVPIYSIQVTKEFVFIFMEYAAHGTLSDFLRKNGAFPEWMARHMFHPIIDALHYLHSNGIAHRDLKLENILLDQFNTPKLTDFSYSLVCKDENPLTQTFCGSLPYMPPEILQQGPYNPQLADVWSLGVCLYIVLNDKLPFKVDNVQMMILSQLGRRFEHRQKIRERLSYQCQDIVNQMLDPDITSRIKTDRLLAHEWFMMMN